MNKRTWKWRGLLADASRAMAEAPSVSAAARQLGVDRSTLHRWARDGKIPRPTGRRRPSPPVSPNPPLRGEQPVSPATWAAAVRAAYVLNATEDTYIDLADEALTMARDTSLKPADRLAAMGRFSALVKQITFEVPDGDIKTTPDTRTRPWPRRVS